MSRIITNNLRHNDATADSLSFDNSGNVSVPNDLAVNTDILFVDASEGRVGIGEASPNRQLVVNGGTSEGVIQITNDTSGTAVANGFELIHFTNGETQLLNRENGAMRFDTNGTERMRILASGGLTFNGDTAAANALDDYEEGTWTPTDASGGAQNPLTASGRYTKIGNLLFCAFDVTYPNTADTAVAAVSLPFSAGPTNLQGAGAFAWQNHGSLMTIYMGSSSNSFSFRNPTDTSQAGIQNNALSGQRLIGSITVRTT